MLFKEVINFFQGGVGEKAVRNILSLSVKVADRSLPLDSDHLKKLSGDIQVGLTFSVPMITRF